MAKLKVSWQSSNLYSYPIILTKTHGMASIAGQTMLIILASIISYPIIFITLANAIWPGKELFYNYHAGQDD